jgi:prepilin-type N-terminal cleavage/methylation domain-containing protein
MCIARQNDALNELRPGEKNMRTICKVKEGFTLIELLIVMAVGAALLFLAIPLFSEAFSPRLKTSAQNLAEDMRFAQNEAMRQGDANPAGGAFRMRKAFVVFDIANNTYSIWRWEDFNGNNIRDAGEFHPELNPAGLGNPSNDRPVRTGRLDSGVYFHIREEVTKSACGSSGPAPGSPVSFHTDAHPPCNGNPCIRFDGKGFIEGLNGAAYLTDHDNSYAISANRAGIFSFCRWDADSEKWVMTH